MNNKIRMFGVAVLILTLITGAILGLLISPANPLTWLLVASLAVVPLLHRRLKSHQHLKWKSDYSVGIASIDAQHRKLIDLINSLQTAVDYSTGEVFERKALDELVDYTKTHFKFEEDMMEQNGYPDFESHRESHVRMIAKVEVTDLGLNRRFVVTNREDLPAQDLYEHYVDRGQAENFVKAFKKDLAMDRLSCHRFLANQFRLWLHALAYQLIVRLRGYLQGPPGRN